MRDYVLSNYSFTVFVSIYNEANAGQQKTTKIYPLQASTNKDIIFCFASECNYNSYTLLLSPNFEGI